MADIINLTTAQFMMANGVHIQGSQNVFFDRLKCPIQVHTMFISSTATKYKINTLRVWTPDGLECDGYYYLQNPPEQLEYNSGDGTSSTTPNLTTRVWKMTSGGDTFTISCTSSIWKLVKNGTINTTGSTVIVTGGIVISQYDTTSVTNNNKWLPLSGAYTNITGHNYAPLIAWSAHKEYVDGIMLVVEMEYGDEISTPKHLQYGFTPYFAPGETQIRVDWGDEVIETIDPSYHGKIVYHTYSVPYLAKKKFLVRVHGNCTRVVFGLNTTYATVRTNANWWKAYDPLDSNTSTASYYWKVCTDRGTWAQGTYNLYDIVTYSGNKYVSTIPSNTYTPNTGGISGSAWKRITEVAYNSVEDNTIYQPYTCITGAPVPSGSGTAPRTLVFDAEAPDYTNYCSLVLNCNWDWSGISNAYDASNVNNLHDGTFMFNKCHRLETEGAQRAEEISGYTVSPTNFTALNALPSVLTTGEGMFQECYCDYEEVVGGTTYNHVASFAHLNALPTGDTTHGAPFTNMDIMFNGCTAGIFGEITNIPSTVITGNTAFNNCTQATFAKLQTIGVNLTQANYMFSNCTSTRFQATTGISNAITYANHMFDGCTLAEFASNFSLPTSLVEANYMFNRVGSASQNDNALTISILPKNLAKADYMFNSSNITINIETLEGANS